jgi:hypothetical protein
MKVACGKTITLLFSILLASRYQTTRFDCCLKRIEVNAY